MHHVAVVSTLLQVKCFSLQSHRRQSNNRPFEPLDLVSQIFSSEAKPQNWPHHRRIGSADRAMI